MTISNLLSICPPNVVRTGSSVLKRISRRARRNRNRTEAISLATSLFTVRQHKRQNHPRSSDDSEDSTLRHAGHYTIFYNEHTWLYLMRPSPNPSNQAAPNGGRIEMKFTIPIHNDLILTKDIILTVHLKYE